MTKHSTDRAAASVPSARALYTAYASGCAYNGVNMMLKVVVPLWALQLGMSPATIGLAIGAGGSSALSAVDPWRGSAMSSALLAALW